MRVAFASLSFPFILLSSSCDSSSNPGQLAEWPLFECFSDQEPDAIFVGRAEIGCLSGDRFREAALDTVGHLFDSLDFYTNEANAVLLLQTAFLTTRAYRINLLAGDVDLLSHPRTIGSQIDEIERGRYMIMDYFYDGLVSDTAYLSFQVADDAGIEHAGGIAVPDIGFLFFHDSDYYADTKESVYLALSTTLDEDLLLRVRHSDLSYDFVSLAGIGNPGQVSFTMNGDVVVLDWSTGSIYSITGTPEEVASLGPPLDSRTYKTFEQGPDDNLYVYSNAGNESTIYSLKADFTLSHVLSIPATIRAMHVNAATGLLCARAWDYPSSGVGDYIDNITYYDISTGVITEATTMLAADQFELPQFGCL